MKFLKLGLVLAFTIVAAIFALANDNDISDVTISLEDGLNIFNE